MSADRALVESTRTHRARMVSALTAGATGRAVNLNTRRFVGSVVVAAVVAAGCVGFSLVHHLLSERTQAAAVSAYQSALAANPLTPTPPATTDPTTGNIVDPTTGKVIDPRTGNVVDPVTGWETTASGRLVDPRTGWYVDPATGRRTDPATGVTIDPTTMQVVDR